MHAPGAEDSCPSAQRLSRRDGAQMGTLQLRAVHVYTTPASIRHVMFHYMSPVMAQIARTGPRPRGPKRCDLCFFNVYINSNYNTTRI